MPEKTRAAEFEPGEVSNICSPPCFSQSPGWFVGLGGSYNSVRIDSVFSGSGITHIYDDDRLVAIGTAGGPAPPFNETLATFAPVAQFGYFQNIGSSDWLWGAKFSYKYLGLTFSDNNFDAFQKGAYHVLDPPSTDTFTGNATTESAQISVDHELLLLPFLGHSFTSGHFYVGGGPVVFGTKSRMYDLRSYADIAGVHTNIGGDPVHLASSTWMWGGACQIGMVYYVSPCCFFDFSYDFMVTGRYTKFYPVSVSSQSGGLTYDTDITYKQFLRVWAQSFTVSFNLKF